MGGWPTIRYFNATTGVSGGTYVKKTSSSMCDELGNHDNMREYVEIYAQTALCSASTFVGCSERERVFIEKMRDKSQVELITQLTRLEGLKSSSMKPELKEWVVKRHAIVRQLETSKRDDEL